MLVAYFTVCAILITFIYMIIGILHQVINKNAKVDYSDGLNVLMAIDLIAGWITSIWAVFLR